MAHLNNDGEGNRTAARRRTGKSTTTRQLEPRDIDIGLDDRAQAARHIDEILANTCKVLSEAAIGALVEGHEELVKLLREATNALDDAGDAATADFFIERLAFHEKAVWMWRALAGSSGSTV